MTRFIPNPKNLGPAWLGLFFCLTALLFLAGSVVRAGESKNLRVMIKDSQVTMDFKRIPDDERHVLALTHRRGKAEAGEGMSAEYESYMIIDAWVGRKGFRKGHSMLTFSDGSKIFYSWTADSKRNQANLPSLKGSGAITKGSGKFKGIEGRVEFSGVQDKPTSQDPSRARTTELTLAYTLP